MKPMSGSKRRRPSVLILLAVALCCLFTVLHGEPTASNDTPDVEKTIARRAAIPANSRCVLATSLVGGCSDTRLCPESMCCSQYGWCGSTTDHCGVGCKSQCNRVNAAAGLPVCSGSAATSSSPSSLSLSTSTSTSSTRASSTTQTAAVTATRCVVALPDMEQCSETRLCPNSQCCSQYGWCGSTAQYCGTGCKSQCNRVNAAAGLPVCGSSSLTSSSVRTSSTPTPTATSTAASGTAAAGGGVLIPTAAANAKDWVPVSWMRNGRFEKDEFGSYQSCGYPGQVAQTYDDGPHETITPTILDALQSAQTKLTFFWLGSLIRSYKSIAQRAAREGHHLASHSYSHPDLTTLSPADLANEVVWTEQQIKDVVGMRPRYFRPPYGSISRGVYTYLANRGYRVILWNLDTFDWRFDVDEQQILNTYVTTLVGKSRTNSYISLQHDIQLKSGNVARATVDAIRGQGFAVVPMYVCLNELAYQR